MVITLFLVFSIPFVQTRLAKMATDKLNATYNTNIHINKIDLSYLGNVKIKGVTINDHHNDSLIYVDKLSTSIFSYRNILNNNLELGDVEADGLYLIMKTYKGEDNDNLSIFADKFSTDTTRSENPFLLTATQMEIYNANFYLYDFNREKVPVVFYKNIDGFLNNFKIEGPNVSANIRDLNFTDNFDLEIIDMRTDFKYTKSKMSFENTRISTDNSKINATIYFNYKREDLAEFVDKVQMEAEFIDSEFSFFDLNKLYSEIGEYDKAYFSGKVKGTLNDFKVNELELITNRKTEVNGHLHLKNVVSREKGFSIQAKMNTLTSNYENLNNLLPNLLENKLPSAIKKLGNFSLTGEAYVSDIQIDTDVTVFSEVGKIDANLHLTDIDEINTANYHGTVEFVDLQFGKIVNDSLIGNLSLIADVKGRGFNMDNINTNINGEIFRYQYKGYTYNNLEINGIFKNKHFNGSLEANDPNLQMSFKGLADLSSDIYRFDFIADVAYSDFNQLNLFKRDSLAVLKGIIDIKLSGNNIDNLAGDINFYNASYTNEKDSYFFKDFNVTSIFNDSVRTVTINSTDILNGRVTGYFKIKEIPKLFENAVANIYTNVSHKNLTKGQFLDFNFRIYNKIVDVFFPEVELGPNTTLKGAVNADEDDFKLTLRSPKVEVYKNVIDNIRLQIDNKNPIYNTLLTMDEIDTEYYNIADVNLVNVTLNDTLFFRTEFKGGKAQTEKYDLSFYHTVNDMGKSVVGLKKSNLEFQENHWVINPNNNRQNKVVFDAGFKTFAFDKFLMVSDEQYVNFAGVIGDRKNKDLNFSLTNVRLSSITPYLETFTMHGIVDGNINYKQVKGEVFPLANLSVKNLIINDEAQGNLYLTARGDKTVENYNIAARLTKDDVDNIFIEGDVDFGGEIPTILANYSFDDYDIALLNGIGKDVVTGIRGKVSGNGSISGQLGNPSIDGYLDLENGGIAIPYLNVDYSIRDKTQVELFNQTFSFPNTTIVDKTYHTEGIFSGDITHRKFDRWILNLRVESDNILVLNTEEDEDMEYYGTGFLDGYATVKGFTDQLSIDVAGKTMPGTEFIVPLSDVTTIGESNLIRFVTDTENGIDKNTRQDVIFDNLKGLEMNFDLEVTDDAVAEIVIDRNTGSVLRGSGNGFMDVAINTNGKFEINGVYVVDKGIYEFRNIVNKNFIVKPGGTVVWNGNPFDAYLDIIAVYQTKANPSVILDNINTNRKIDVNLIANITGQLMNSDIDFDVQLPDQNSVMESELKFKLNSENEKMTQFFSLLISNSFRPIEQGTLALDGNAAIYGTISEKISSILTGLLKTEGDLFQMGVTYDLASRDDIRRQLNDQLGISFTSTIADKLTIDGRAYVPIGTNTYQSNIIGEVELGYPLNEERTLMAKAYTKQNDIEYDVADAEGYTHGVGISYTVDFDNAKELAQKIFGIKSKKKEQVAKKDSIIKEKKLIDFMPADSNSLPAKTSTINKE